MNRMRILCPMDFSEASTAALDYAVKMAAATQSEVIIAHAFDQPAHWDRASQTEPDDPSLRGRLEAVPCEVPCLRLLHAGPPGRVICWLAQEYDCDLIVMGTRGASGLAHLLFGSTAEYVLHHARCPVLTLRLPKPNEPRLEEPIVLPVPGGGA